MWSQIFKKIICFNLNERLKKNLRADINELLNFFLSFQHSFVKKWEKQLKNLRPQSQNSLVSTFFYVFYAKLQDETKKSY